MCLSNGQTRFQGGKTWSLLTMFAHCLSVGACQFRPKFPYALVKLLDLGCVCDVEVRPREPAHVPTACPIWSALHQLVANQTARAGNPHQRRCILSLHNIDGINISTIWAIRESVRIWITHCFCLFQAYQAKRKERLANQCD